MKKITKRVTVKTRKQFLRLMKQIAEHNERRNPLNAVPESYDNYHRSFIPFGRNKNFPIGPPEGTDGHGAVFGGTGSGKSSCFCFPALLGWKGAIVCTDIKGELSNLHKRLRRFNYVERPELIFDPEDKQCPRYDPFALINCFPYDKHAIISSLALTLIPVSQSANPENSFWTDTSRNFLKAAFIFCYNRKQDFIRSVEFIQVTPIPELIAIIKECDGEASAFFSSSIAFNPHLLASIDVDIHNALEVFTDPYIARAFSRTFSSDIENLTWDKINKYDIFLKLPVEKIKHWKTAFNILYSQLIFSLNKRKDKYSGGERNIQTLLLMDEFASFGRIPHFEEDISTLRSKSVNIFMVLQSLAQIDQLYSVDGRKAIMDNCSHKLIFRCDDADTRRYFAELIGTRKVLKPSLSVSFDCERNMSSMSIAEEQLHIIEPHELGTLDDDVIVVSEGHPYRLQKIGLVDHHRLNLL